MLKLLLIIMSWNVILFADSETIKDATLQDVQIKLSEMEEPYEDFLMMGETVCLKTMLPQSHSNDLNKVYIFTKIMGSTLLNIVDRERLYRFFQKDMEKRIIAEAKELCGSIKNEPFCEDFFSHDDNKTASKRMMCKIVFTDNSHNKKMFRSFMLDKSNFKSGTVHERYNHIMKLENSKNWRTKIMR